MSLKIPRITKTEAKDLKLANKSAIKILHHKEVNKAKPPPISIHEESESDLEMICKSSARAFKRDSFILIKLFYPKPSNFQDITHNKTEMKIDLQHLRHCLYLAHC